jgi:hypothetical protein
MANLTLRERAFVSMMRARNMETTLAHWRTWPRKVRLGIASTARKGAHPTVGYIDGYLAGWKARGRVKR